MSAPATEIDQKIRRASARLAEVKELGDVTLMEFYANELDLLLDEKLEAGIP